MIYSLDAVTKKFPSRQGPVPAVEGISLQVPRGEHLALLGQSGAGKTTLFRLLNASIRATSGHVHFDGHDLGQISAPGLPTMRRRIGTIYQQHNLVPSLTALENTLCGSLGRWTLLQTVRSIFRPAKADVEQAMHALELVGLSDKMYARADELSGGQQQRLAIGRVLMQDPEVILADEPVASLDPALSEEITALLKRVASEGKRTLIVSLHRVELALEHFPRVVALKKGAISFNSFSRDVNKQVLESLYAKDTNGAEQEKHGSDFRRELGCSR